MRKREPRRAVLLPARMRTGSGWVDVSIRNISTRGLLVRSGHAVRRGTYVEIRRDAHIIVGRAVWSSGDHFGVLAQDRMDVDAIVARPALADYRPPQDRRHRPRDQPSGRRMADRSRHVARQLQFAGLGAAALGGAALMAGTAFDLLQRPLAVIGLALAGSGR